MLDNRAHQSVDQLVQNQLARECLRDLDHRREIETVDRRFDRPRWCRPATVLPQLRMELIELPHLSIGSPSEVTPPCVSQIEIRDLLESARRIKAGSQLVGERFVMDKTVCACRRDGAVVKVHGIERASLDTGNLSADQRSTILEVWRTIDRPGPKLLLMSPKYFSMLGVRVGPNRLTQCGARQRGIKVKFRLLQQKERQ